MIRKFLVLFLAVIITACSTGNPPTTTPVPTNTPEAPASEFIISDRGNEIPRSSQTFEIAAGQTKTLYRNNGNLVGTIHFDGEKLCLVNDDQPCFMELPITPPAHWWLEPQGSYRVYESDIEKNSLHLVINEEPAVEMTRRMDEARNGQMIEFQDGSIPTSQRFVAYMLDQQDNIGQCFWGNYTLSSSVDALVERLNNSFPGMSIFLSSTNGQSFYAQFFDHEGVSQGWDKPRADALGYEYPSGGCYREPVSVGGPAIPLSLEGEIADEYFVIYPLDGTNDIPQACYYGMLTDQVGLQEAVLSVLNDWDEDYQFYAYAAALGKNALDYGFFDKNGNRLEWDESRADALPFVETTQCFKPEYTELTAQ